MNPLSLLSGRHWALFSTSSLVGLAALSACGGGGSGASVPTATPIGTPVATSTSTPVPTPTATTPPVTGAALLVFAMAPDGATDAAQTDIFAVNPDGTNLRRLTTGISDSAGNVQPNGSPALSPNRSQVVYVAVSSSGGGSQSQLRIMNVNGSNNRLLTSDANANGATSPTWSPDGQRIAFSKGNDGIFTVNADGSNLRQLTNSGSNPSWSIGNRIAFNAAPGVQVVATGTLNKRKTRGVLPPGTSAYTDIYTVGADGSGLLQLTQRAQTDAGLACINPSWSPNGQTLVFNSIPGSGIPAQLYLINANGTNRRTLGTLTGTDAVWSPDGNRIAYSSEAGLSTANTNGGNVTLLNPADNFFVDDTDWR
ncbi:protein TolB [Abditibacteriota bacterium]|nr:protein TolB [Abditibacteriota bacterium]